VVTGPATVVGVSGGFVAEKLAEANDDDDLKEVAGFIKDLIFGAAVDGLSCGTLNSGASVVAKGTKMDCQGISKYNDTKNLVNGEYVPMASSKELGTVANHVMRNGL